MFQNELGDERAALNTRCQYECGMNSCYDALIEEMVYIPSDKIG